MSAYRNDLDALAARHDALAAEVAGKTKELTEAAHMLEQARAHARLPVLDNLRIASPCTADWAAMTGDDRVRACSLCNKNVYNLSEMTREEAQALLLEKEGKLCARYYQRKDGTILLKDCEVGVSKKRRRRWIAAGASALLASGAGVMLLPSEKTPPPEMVQGGAQALPTTQEPEPAPEQVPTVLEIKPVVPEEAPRPLMGAIAITPQDLEPARPAKPTHHRHRAK
jgi:hypothetical protein